MASFCLIASSFLSFSGATAERCQPYETIQKSIFQICWMKHTSVEEMGCPWLDFNRTHLKENKKLSFVVLLLF